MKIIEEQHVKKFWAFLEISKPINRWAEQGVTWLNRKERLHINVKHELGAGNQDPDRQNLLYFVHSYYVLLHFYYLLCGKECNIPDWAYEHKCNVSPY